jgi:hypothetical protein
MLNKNFLILTVMEPLSYSPYAAPIVTEVIQVTICIIATNEIYYVNYYLDTKTSLKTKSISKSDINLY